MDIIFFKKINPDIFPELLSRFGEYWKNFESRIQDGDEIWYFNEHLFGGYVILRNGIEVERLITEI